VKPALALSLHTTKAALREAAAAARAAHHAGRAGGRGERYARATGYPIQFQWTLIEGVNDGDDEIEGIAAAVGQVRADEPDPLQHRRRRALPPPVVGTRGGHARTLHRRGILTKLRQSAGQDVDAGCGQLRSRAGTAEPRQVQEQPITLHR
jgi:23S rRNA (adenine2503-C2)-methyltransferase